MHLIIKLKPVALTLGLLALPALSWAVGETTLLHKSSDGTQGNWYVDDPSISADGRYVAFVSAADNLVAGDTNDADDIFLRDRVTGKTTRISVAANGTEANDYSSRPRISADGIWVVFASDADNLVPNDNNQARDIFLYNRATKAISRINLASNGTQANASSGSASISADGRYIAFDSSASNLVGGDTNGTDDVFLHDRVLHATSLISQDQSKGPADGNSRFPVISANGRYVAFVSYADDLVASDSNGGTVDAFVRDRITNQTSIASLSTNGDQGNWGVRDNYASLALSADGRYLAFASDASNLVPGDTNGWRDIFVRDRVKNITSRVSVSSGGTQGNGPSEYLDISADGRFVVFGSGASNLVGNDSNGSPFDVFVRDRVANQTSLASVNTAGAPGSSSSEEAAISADGRYVAFTSFSSNLVANDVNGEDVFLRDRQINRGAQTDLKVTITDSVDPVALGQPLTYRVTLTNVGKQDAGSAQAMLWLTPSLNATLPSSIVPSSGNCTRSPLAVCRLGTIKAGKSATITVTFNKAPVGGTMRLTAAVNAAPKDPVPGNNLASQVTTVVK